MPKTASTKTRQGGGKKTKKKVILVVKPTVQELQNIQKSNHDEHGQPKATKSNYGGYIKRGKEFLTLLVERRRAQGDSASMDGLDTNILEKAFNENQPNEYSATALELYLTEKCFNEGHGRSTADGIHSAWANYWDNMNGDKYSGPYTYDEETKTVKGCPAHAKIVKQLVKDVRNRDGRNGGAATRHHAEAMHPDDLQKIIECSEQQVPPTLTRNEQSCPSELSNFLIHSMMRAFLSTGFTLWTRNFELCQLQWKHLKLNLQTAHPYCVPYFKVFLENRKGWQHQQKGEWDGELLSNTYNIYQQDRHSIDMFTHLLHWLQIMESELGRSLENDDYVFPFIGSNGIVNPRQGLQHQFVQNLLNDFTKAAGVDKYFTTHSLRRGGAQYRLMHAPIGTRWSLSRIRWWGGWAEGESIDVLMKYLIDSLIRLEEGHQDALSPVAVDISKSYLGEDDLLKPATKADLRQLANLVDRTQQTVTSGIMVTTSSRGPPGPYTHVSDVSVGATASDGISMSSGDQSPTPTLPKLKSTDSRNSLPIPGVAIPNIGRGRKSWKKAVEQWEQDDPAKNFRALKDWPREWYTGVMRPLTGSKRQTRRLITEEYKYLGRSDVAFEAMYSLTITRGINALVREIRSNKAKRGDIKRRHRKNGASENRIDEESGDEHTSCTEGSSPMEMAWM